MIEAATEELQRGEAAGEQPRGDLLDRSFVTVKELLEGTVLQAAEAYEERKAPFLGYFVVAVLHDPNQDLAEIPVSTECD